MNKQQELKERIYKYCPELKELTFGCELKPKKVFQFPQYTYSDKFIFINEVGGEQIADTGDFDEYTTFLLESETKEVYTQDIDVRCDFEILGHPIQLQHVLRAAFLSGNSLNISELGEIFQIIGGERVYRCIYDLKKSFDQNCADNPKLVDFLLEVIK